MLEISEYVNIREHCTLKVGGQFRYFAAVHSAEEVKEVCLFAQRKNLKVFPLGSGSNIVFPDGVLDVVALKLHILGFETINDTEEYLDIKIGAGEEWDSVVARSVDMNLAGIEALSAIPGTAGATPVQNVGAYGQEIKNTLQSVEVFDTESQTLKSLSNEKCEFAYRDSIFKGKAKSRYVITSILLRLSKNAPTVPDYPGVKKYFESKNISNPSLSEIRNAIIEIRKTKLPNPKIVANVGSFFKNAIVGKEVAEKLQSENSGLATFPLDNIHTKVPAGWLIERADLKGKDFGTIEVYKENALVLVNKGGATRADVEHVKTEIIKIVREKFGITLEAEPEFV